MLLRQQPLQPVGPQRLECSAGCHQHGASSHRIPQSVPCIAQGREFHNVAPETQPHRNQFTVYGVSGRCPKHHRQHQIGSASGQQQHSDIHVGIEHTAGHRNAAVCQQRQRQYTACQCTGEREHQQDQTQQAAFPQESNGRHDNSCGNLTQPGSENPAARQKHCHGVGTAEQCRQQVPSPTEGDTGQLRRRRNHQIVHHRVQGKHTVDIHHGHDGFPLPCPQEFERPRPNRGENKMAWSVRLHYRSSVP